MDPMASILAQRLSRAAGVLLAVAWLSLAGADPAQANADDDLQQAREAFERGDRLAGIAALSRAIDSGELQPEQLAFALQMRATAYLVTEQEDQALADASRLVQLEPDRGRALLLRAEIEERKGMADAALADVDKALADKSLTTRDRVEANIVRGTVWGEQRAEHGRALAAFELALEIDADSIDARLGRAMALRGLGRFDEALLDFDELVRREPDDTMWRLRRCDVHYLKRDFRRAIEDCDDALARGASTFVGRTLRGVANYNLRQLDEAVRDFDVAATGPEQDYELALWHYFALLRAGDAQRAQTVLDHHAIHGAEPVPRPRWPQAVYQYFIGAVDSAEVQIRALNSHDPLIRARQTCEADFYLGEFAALRGDTAAAKAALTRAMTDCPAASEERVAAETTLAELGN
ncbi:MAG TPA: tetratricopeptide repeat protein [Candidatus Acidoferrum sp.]|nr:tetratricopeptide repeat protein [Candidatus Acidoferrum sp.]